jgi:hypothetical protein
MKRDDYLADSHVASFVQWAGHLVRGKWGLEHAYQGKGPRFQCSTLFEAFQQYRWPDSRNGESFEGTVTGSTTTATDSIKSG